MRDLLLKRAEGIGQRLDLVVHHCIPLPHFMVEALLAVIDLQHLVQSRPADRHDRDVVERLRDSNDLPGGSGNQVADVGQIALALCELDKQFLNRVLEGGNGVHGQRSVPPSRTDAVFDAVEPVYLAIRVTDEVPELIDMLFSILQDLLGFRSEPEDLRWRGLWGIRTIGIGRPSSRRDKLPELDVVLEKIGP